MVQVVRDVPLKRQETEDGKMGLEFRDFSGFNTLSRLRGKKRRKILFHGRNNRQVGHAQMHPFLQAWIYSHSGIFRSGSQFLRFRLTHHLKNKAGYPALDAPSTRYTAFFKMLTDTRTHGRTHPLKEMRRRI